MDVNLLFGSLALVTILCLGVLALAAIVFGRRFHGKARDLEIDVEPSPKKQDG